MVAHNHPSGNPQPSREDLEVTKRLGDVGKIIGIEILDHIIVGQGQYIP
ncbi:JAB domain-containing protein [Aeribacillus composti]|nr:JAB domain-containing protein [Aeribacillus composti]